MRNKYFMTTNTYFCVLIAQKWVGWKKLIDSRLHRIAGIIKQPLIRHLESLVSISSEEKASRELRAYKDAIGKLALISITNCSGKIIQINEKLCEISGYSQEELIGQDHSILNSGLHSRPFFVEMLSAIANGQIRHKEICNRSKNGNIYWVDSTIVPLKNEQGIINRYLSVSVDITERKQKAIEMDKKLKESNCLNLIRQDLVTYSNLETILNHVVRHMIDAIHQPEFSAIRIELFDTVITSENYTDELNEWISTPISIYEEACGQLQIFSLKQDIFDLTKKQCFIETISYELGKWLERKETENHILRMATHDALTQLPNRHLLLDRLEHALASDARYNLKMAVLFIDLDHFKIINDAEGHEVGDLLLKEMANRLLQCMRKEDTVARQGGDEFIVVLHQIKTSEDAGFVAQKIINSLAQPFHIQKKILHIGCSIGIAVFPNDGKNASVLLKHSDIAMYHAKETGRNNYKFFTQELNASAHEKQVLKTELYEALRQDQLILYFQPVFSMPNYELKCLEVLMRWNHPEKKLIMPQQFISLAEDSGMIIPIGEWVINAVCKQIKIWQEYGIDIPQIAINLSTKQFKDDSLIKKISGLLAETGLPGQHIALEITESLLIDDFEKVEKTINQLKAMGIKLSIDDFGTGYSNFGYLKRFQIDTLKIDRSFVQDITTNSGDHAIITAMITLAKNLDLDIIAEGVENQDQLELLMLSGCTQFQGYFFSKPLPAHDLEQFLENSAHWSSKKMLHMC